MRSALAAGRVILLSLVFCNGVMAQTQTGRIWGTVMDSTGGVIPAASVTVTNVGTNLSKNLAADDRGRFVFTDLQPGEYEISAEVPGFKKFVRSGTVLRVADSLEISIKLEVGSPTEVVNVSAETPLLNTTTSSLGEVVENRSITELPLNGRQTLSLVTLVPGVTPNRQMDNSAQPFNRAGNFSVGGARGDTNELLLDGAPNTLPEGSSGAMTAVASFPSPDSTLEFKVQSNNFSAEYGRTGGGVVNIVTKSGTNDLHGSLFEFMRNSVLDSNNFFNNANGIPLASFKRNQFGATLGGPVRIPGVYNGKNRTFFFFSWESLLERAGLTIPFNVPTDKQRSGDFSDTYDAAGHKVIIYDPGTTVFNTTYGTFLRSPFSGNVIPSSRIDPVMKKVLAYFPEPTGSGAPFTHAQNYVRSVTQPTNDHKFDIRIDHQISSKQSLFGRFSYGNRDWNLPSVYGNIADNYASAFPMHTRNIALGDTYSLGPKFLLDLKYSYNYLYFGQNPASVGFNLTDLGFPQYMYDNAQTHEFPKMIYNYGEYGSMGFLDNNQWGRQESHAGMASLSRITGNHVMKFGADIRMNRANRFANYFGSGAFLFSPLFTQGPVAYVASTTSGNTLASAMLGDPVYGAQDVAAAPAAQNWYDGFYIQDDWKITQRLTLNLGLRYDLEWPFTERFNHVSWFDPSLASPIASQVPSLNLKGAVQFATPDRRTPWNVDKNNFAPRVGIAYEVKDKWVVRAGYGIFYAPHPYGTSDNIGYGFSSETPFVATLDYANPIGKLSNPFPTGYVPVLGAKGGPGTNLGLDMTWFDLQAATPYVQQWNFSIQRKIGTTMVIDAAYSGSKGTKIPDGGGYALNQLRANQLGPQNNVLVANPFYGIITQGALASDQISAGQLLTAFPQYDSSTGNGVGLQTPSASSSIFHSFQLRANKRFAQGLSFLISYTNGKVIDDNSGMSSWLEPTSGHQNFYNRRADRAISDQDISQRLVTSFNYQLPFGRTGKFGHNWSPVVDSFFGGWQVNGILSFQSGIPLSITTDNTSYSNSIVLRPNNNGQSAGLEGSAGNRIDKFFKTEVFSAPALYTFGNVGRNLPDVRGPGQSNLDFSIFKNIKLAEGKFVQFRSEFFNLTNTPEFDNPDTSLQSDSFGHITSQRNRPRQIQFGLKIVF